MIIIIKNIKPMYNSVDIYNGYFLEQRGFAFRKGEKKTGCATKREGFIVKEDTKCESDENVQKNFRVPNEDSAWIGCEKFNCKMIVNVQSKGEDYSVCHGKPVKDTKGSCSWVKGIFRSHLNGFNLI